MSGHISTVFATVDSSNPRAGRHGSAWRNLTSCQKAFMDTYNALGKRHVDLDQGSTEGVGTLPKCLREGQRFSTSALYLSAARSRANLTIRSNCLVDKLVLERSNGSLTAMGVEAIINGERCQFSAGHVTLSAGAINSPAILQRSGIGAAAEIARSNIKPLLDLPGVEEPAGPSIRGHLGHTQKRILSRW